MYYICIGLETLIKGIRVFLKLSYYKLKYGKRLKLGKGNHFRKGLIINISKNGKLTIGNGNFFNNYCSINCKESITIGDDNIFGESVKIYDHNHVFNDKAKNIKKSFKCNSVIIGDNNWFASNVIILSKANVGDRNVFGAGVIINEEHKSNHLITSSVRLKADKIRYKGTQE